MSCIECSISCCPGGEQCRSFNWLHLCTWIAAEATIARCRCRWNYIYIFFYDYFWYCSACTCDWISLSESRCWAAVLSSTSSSFCAREMNGIHVLHTYYYPLHYFKKLFYSKQTTRVCVAFAISLHRFRLALRLNVVTFCSKCITKNIAGTWVARVTTLRSRSDCWHKNSFASGAFLEYLMNSSHCKQTMEFISVAQVIRNSKDAFLVAATIRWKANTIVVFLLFSPRFPSTFSVNDKMRTKFVFFDSIFFNVFVPDSSLGSFFSRVEMSQFSIFSSFN